MRFNFDILSNHRTRFKCGAEVWSAVGLGVSGLFSAAAADSASERSTSLNMMENEKNRRFSSKEAEKQRNWQSSEFDRQFAKQLNSWYSQQEYQKDVNSPYAQVQRLQKAGINPASAIGSVSTGGMSFAGNPPSPSPSGSMAAPTSSIPVASPTTGADAFAHIANSIGGLVSSLSKAGKDNADANQTNKSLNLILRNLAADVQGKELVNTYQDMYNTFFDKKAPKDLQKLGKEIDELTMKIVLADTHNELLDEQVITEQFRQLLLSHQSDLTAEQLIQAKILTDKYGSLLTSQINANKASEAQGYATAFNQRAQGVTENSLRELRYKSLDLNNELIRAQGHGLRLDNWLKDSTLKEQASIIVEQAKQAKLITKEEAYELATQIYNYDTRKVNNFFKWLGQGIGAYRDFGIGTSMSTRPPVKSTPIDSPWTIYGQSNTSY